MLAVRVIERSGGSAKEFGIIMGILYVGAD